MLAGTFVVESIHHPSLFRPGAIHSTGRTESHLFSTKTKMMARELHGGFQSVNFLTPARSMNTDTPPHQLVPPDNCCAELADVLVNLSLVIFSAGPDAAARLYAQLQSDHASFHGDISSLLSGPGLTSLRRACSVVQTCVMPTLLPPLARFLTSRTNSLAVDIVNVLRRGNRRPSAIRGRSADVCNSPAYGALCWATGFNVVMRLEPILSATSWAGLVAGILTGVSTHVPSTRPIAEILNDPALRAALNKARYLLSGVSTLNIPGVRSFQEWLDLNEPDVVPEWESFVDSTRRWNEQMSGMLNQRGLSLATMTPESIRRTNPSNPDPNMRGDEDFALPVSRWPP